MSISNRQIKWAVLATSIAAYVASLRLPALIFQQHESLYGIEVLLWGWWGVLVLEFAWFANPAYLLAIAGCMGESPKLTKLASTVGLMLGLTSFHAKEWWFDEGSGTLIIGLGPGFYVWMLSLCILLVGAFFTSPSRRRAPGSLLNE